MNSSFLPDMWDLKKEFWNSQNGQILHQEPLWGKNNEIYNLRSPYPKDASYKI